MAAQQGFQFLGQGEVVAEAAVLREVDQQIDIAVRAFLAPGRRAEQAQVRRAMSCGNLVQRVAAELKVIAQGHGRSPCPADVSQELAGIASVRA